MLNPSKLALLLLVAQLYVSVAAEAQGLHCGPRDAMVEALATAFQEQPVSRGVTSQGALMEILAGPSGTWSVLVTAPGGATCLVASGEGWRSLPQFPKSKEPAV